MASCRYGWLYSWSPLPVVRRAGLGERRWRGPAARAVRIANVTFAPPEVANVRLASRLLADAGPHEPRDVAPRRVTPRRPLHRPPLRRRHALAGALEQRPRHDLRADDVALAVAGGPRRQRLAGRTHATPRSPLGMAHQ